MSLPSGPLSRLKHGSSGTAATAAYSSSDEPMTHRNGAAVEIDIWKRELIPNLPCLSFTFNNGSPLYTERGLTRVLMALVLFN